jgi:DNA-directed RNA polymerase subunit RPC12/RpoP
MSSNAVQYDRQKASHKDEFHETEGTTVSKKVIIILQVCIRCGQEFAFKQGRKSCPHCSGLLIAKTMVRGQT